MKQVAFQVRPSRCVVKKRSIGKMQSKTTFNISINIKENSLSNINIKSCGGLHFTDTCETSCSLINNKCNYLYSSTNVFTNFM
jgi:hypothetical protein